MDDRRSDGTEREIPSPEVSEKPTRRRFMAEYKLRILAEAEACTERGSLGELLRREGLYSSHLGTWQKQREEGVLAGLTPDRRHRSRDDQLVYELYELTDEEIRIVEEVTTR